MQGMQSAEILLGIIKEIKMHSVKIILIANQEICINGDDVNIHDIHSITVFGDRITGYAIKETPEELRKRLLDYLKTPETESMINSMVPTIISNESPGAKYSHSFDKEDLLLTVQGDFNNLISVRHALIKALPAGIGVEVNEF